MVKKEHIIRTSFSAKQYNDVNFLMDSMHVDTPHELVRMLIAREADERRGNQMRYGGAPKTVPRETKAQKARRIMSMSDADLNVYLMPLLKEEFCKNEGDSVEVFTEETTKMRKVLAISPSTGMRDTMNLDYYFRRWESEKRLPDLPDLPSPGPDSA